MISTEDLFVNASDDFIIAGEDILLESNPIIVTVNNAKRRLEAYGTDNRYIPEIAAGLESFMQKQINLFTLSNLELTIATTLTHYSLLNNREIEVSFDTSDEGRLGVLVRFMLPTIDENLTSFSIFINKQNQRSYI
jgi:hypothetical protein